MPETTITIEQVESYFKLPRGFVGRYRMRLARRLGVPATTLAAWRAVMEDIASAAGTFGEFTTDVRAFEEAVGEPERFGTSPEDIAKDVYLATLWRMLERAKLVEIIDGQPEPQDGLEGLPSEFRVLVLGIRDANEPRKPPKSGAERQAKYRRRKSGDARYARDVTPSRVTDQRNGDGVTSRDAEPTNQPTNQPDEPDEPAQPRAYASAPARMAAAASGENVDEQHPSNIDRQIETTRRDLGPDLCRLAGAIVDNARERHHRPVDKFTEHRDFLRPLARLLEHHDAGDVVVAAEKAVARGAFSVKLVEQIVTDPAPAAAVPPAARGTRRRRDVDPTLQAMFDAADPDAPTREAGAA